LDKQGALCVAGHRDAGKQRAEGQETAGIPARGERHVKQAFDEKINRQGKAGGHSGGDLQTLR
ncbi:hypothetical protein CSC88_36485, partial [Klebsiella pneumoniae]